MKKLVMKYPSHVGLIEHALLYVIDHSTGGRHGAGREGAEIRRSSRITEHFQTFDECDPLQIYCARKGIRILREFLNVQMQIGFGR